MSDGVAVEDEYLMEIRCSVEICAARMNTGGGEIGLSGEGTLPQRLVVIAKVLADGLPKVIVVPEFTLEESFVLVVAVTAQS